jgi:thiosulfate/3-mercaptopyruvate sulfurtransferase
MNWTTLVSVDALRACLGDAGLFDAGLVIVDARFGLGDAQAGEAAFRASRIPGARYAHLDRDLSDKSRPAAEGRHPLPTIDAFRHRLGAWGIDPDTQVVAYDAGDGAMAAARLWWLLRLVGHRHVAVLDGGFAAWAGAGAPIETDAPASTQDVGEYPVRAFDATQIATTEEIATRLAQSPGWLLDARSGERFRGEVEPIDRVAGHVPGARNRPFGDNLHDGRFRPAAELREQFLELTEHRDPREVVLACGSGVTACHNLLAMEAAGLAGARIYAPSWSGWISDPARPVANGPAD